MAELTLNTGLLILIFWVVVPTVDQYSDLGLVFRLYTGPEQDLMVSGGRCHESFCYMQYCSITIPDFLTNYSKTSYSHHLWEDDGAGIKPNFFQILCFGQGGLGLMLVEESSTFHPSRRVT